MKIIKVFITKINERLTILDIFSPGQDMLAQVLLSYIAPKCVQFAPPYIGVGLSHVRFLYCIPPPQDEEHSVQLDQSVRLPLTKN